MSDEPFVIVDDKGQIPLIDNLMTDEVKNRLIEFLRFIFSNSSLYRYTDDEVNSRIYISDVFPVKEDYEKKPSVVVSRENLFLTNRGIGHFHSFKIARNLGYRFLDLLQSQVVIECYSRQGLEAEKIANIVFFSILAFRRKLRQVGRIHDVLTAGIGKEIPQKTSSDIILAMVPVTLSFTHREMWTIQEVGQDLFQGIDLTVLPIDPPKMGNG